ncbi:hypothetical protein [Aldersonia kunmingensis]|uniref:hypothetical protein n=1 Tax=Aldersonia kunmingensis TaxID=408066 RepID=UPI0012ED4C84|nr:hypothetical protein [Aldersonia kunmingensis]
MSELVIAKSPRAHFFTEFAVSDPRDALLGYAQLSGNMVLLILNAFTNSWLFPCRPMKVRDQEDEPTLWIEFRGILRRFVVIVRRPDGSVLGRLVGRTWATTLRNTGYSIEIDGERVGGWTSSTYTPRHTVLRAQQSLAEPLAAIAFATAIVRHSGG